MRHVKSTFTVSSHAPENDLVFANRLAIWSSSHLTDEERYWLLHYVFGKIAPDKLSRMLWTNPPQWAHRPVINFSRPGADAKQLSESLPQSPYDLQPDGTVVGYFNRQVVMVGGNSFDLAALLSMRSTGQREDELDQQARDTCSYIVQICAKLQTLRAYQRGRIRVVLPPPRAIKFFAEFLRQLHSYLLRRLDPVYYCSNKQFCPALYIDSHNSDFRPAPEVLRVKANGRYDVHLSETGYKHLREWMGSEI